MKRVISIQPISRFIYTFNRKERFEIEHYSDGTQAIVAAVYYQK